MAKRERIEDMGRAFEKMNTVLDNEVWEYFRSKHQTETFIEKCKKNDYFLEEIHFKLRCLFQNLEEIHSILYGDVE